MKIQHLCKSFDDRVVLDHVSLTLESGGTACLMAPSGRGKTTLLRCIAGLERPDSGQITDLPERIGYVFQEDRLIPGLSAHMPEAILYSDANGYDVETYIQIFNCMGFLMQVEVEGVARIIRNAKKPVMTIKPFAAGRVSPFVGLNFNWSVLRDQDMITMGVMSEAEVHEDVEISFAALERRFPELAGRSSPAKNQAVLQG